MERRIFLAYWGIGFLNLNENPLRIQFGADKQNELKVLIKYDNPNPIYRKCYENNYNTDQQEILNKSSWNKLDVKNSFRSLKSCLLNGN